MNTYIDINLFKKKQNKLYKCESKPAFTVYGLFLKI